MEKNDYHHGNLKEELLQKAFEFIDKEDSEKLTLKILSDATGTSRSAIYRHFKNKDELIETVIKAGFERFDQVISSPLQDMEKPLIDRFYMSAKAYMEFAKDNPNLYRLLFGRKYSHIREEILSIKDEQCSGFGALKKAVEEGQKDGVLKKEDSYCQAIIIWSSLHGLASLRIDGFMDVEEIFEELFDKQFKALLDAVMANKVKILSTLPFVNKILEPKQKN